MSHQDRLFIYIYIYLLPFHTCIKSCDFVCVGCMSELTVQSVFTQTEAKVSKMSESEHRRETARLVVCKHRDSRSFFTQCTSKIPKTKRIIASCVSAEHSSALRRTC